MKAGECLLSLAFAIRGGITFASQAQHPILQQHAKLCSNHTSSVPQLQSLASLATLCRPRDEQPSTMFVAHSLQQPSCMPQRTQQQTIRCHQSGSQTAAAPSLKQRLRELMMLVHPDRWSAHPKARQENERSFKLLNEYLEAAKAVSVLIVTTDNVLLNKSSCPQLSLVLQIGSRLEPFPRRCSRICIWCPASLRTSCTCSMSAAPTSLAMQGGTAALAAGPAYHFVFYLHQQLQGEPSEDEANGIADESPRRIAVSLPPPVRSRASIRQSTSILRNHV